MTTSKGNLDTVYPALLVILTNIAPYIQHISPTTCSKVIQFFSSMSAPSFLLANETNHALLASFLDFINSVLEHNFTGMFFTKHVYLRIAFLNASQKTPILFMRF